ncbi:MAG TPA: hypothetical protein VGB73_08260 [Pyrinomonadaceae bacterium]|jgi:microcompartment protein CcmL/EutN
MSVIGRLDKQVEDVLISPVSKTREKPEKVPSADDRESEPIEEERQTETTQNQKRREKETLPVWIL